LNKIYCDTKVNTYYVLANDIECLHSIAQLKLKVQLPLYFIFVNQFLKFEKLQTYSTNNVIIMDTD